MRLFFLLNLFLFLTGCKNSKKIPAGVLTQNEMQLIMWDLIRADEYVSNFLLKDSGIIEKQARLQYYNDIYKIHETDEEQFRQSLSFYQSRPDLMKVIMDSLRRYESKIYQQQLLQSKPDTGATPEILPQQATDSLVDRKKGRLRLKQ